MELSLISLLIWLAAFVTLVVTSLLIYARWNYGVLERLGVPVVKPHFFLGSTFNCRKPVGYRDRDWMKEYGPVFGVYEGREPKIFVCDPEILRLIMVKDTNSHFNSKGHLDFGDPFLNEMPDYLPGEKWRLVRSFTSPAFTTAKLRLMSFPMQESLQDFINDLKLQVRTSDGGIFKNCPFEDMLFNALTDLTLRSLFSVQDKSDRFPALLRQFANPEGLKYPLMSSLALSFPVLFHFFPPNLLHDKPAREFRRIMEQLIDSRKVSGKKASPPDVIDICIEQIQKLETEDYKNANVTTDTIMFQAFNFFFSGQDETALVISAMIYHILQDTTVQERLYEEVDSIWEGCDDGNLPREKLLEADYLQACINEALRLYPFYNTERVCTKEWLCEKYNFKVPKGMQVVAALWAVNRNPEYFENPEQFNPDRFTAGSKEKLHPYAWSSFGHGPRHCTGKPLSLEVLRFACAYIFKEFQFHLRDDTALTFHPIGPWVFINHEPIYFDVTLRH